MNNDIILNWLPPANENFSSAAMSVLQNFMIKNGFDTKVCFWNILLKKTLSSFYKSESHETDLSVLALFNVALAYELNDTNVITEYKALLMEMQPSKIYLNSDVDLYLRKCVQTLYKDIDFFFDIFHFKDCDLFGFSLKLYQWIPAVIFAKRIKELNKNAKIIVGGITSKKEAITFLNNFATFDYAIWGEGEQTLLETVKALKGDLNFQDIAHLAYREDEQVITNNIAFEYTDLSSEENVLYDDFLSAINYAGICRDKIQIMVEAGRGCHWQKCKFCFLNDGYRFRVKEPNAVINELKKIIENYKFYTYNFTDNDIVGGSISHFLGLLDALIELKKQYPKFEVGMAEIITRGLTRDNFRKMSVAGFCHIQIGYESPSESILRKINKSNSFASNLMAMKWCQEYKINISGLNIIRGLPEETSTDILEAIQNLKYERFYIDGYHIYHEYTDLAISFMSRYYKSLKAIGLLHTYKSPLRRFIPRDLFNEDDELILLSASKIEYNALWDVYRKLDVNLAKNPFTYSIIRMENYIYYKEMRKEKLIQSLSFEIQSLEWNILTACNESVLTLSDIRSILDKYSESDIKYACSELSSLGLLYQNSESDEFCSIINTDNYN